MSSSIHEGKSALLSLVTGLAAAPSRENRLCRPALLDAWDKLRQESLRHRAAPTPQLMAGLLLDSPEFGHLLDEAERSQLQALVRRAIDRYEAITHPPNKLGNTLAGIIKESL
jgi:hypothetical protein